MVAVTHFPLTRVTVVGVDSALRFEVKHVFALLIPFYQLTKETKPKPTDLRQASLGK